MERWLLHVASLRSQTAGPFDVLLAIRTLGIMQTLQVSAVDRNADGAMCMAGEFVAFHPWSIGGPGVTGSVY